ncbi:AraC family transcriptional regulator [Lachnoclostridium phytofermentans]|uniref:Transcriptional regulator, AraC family n=1 Tax=Lachnoclostridium phytofermentans (strain ATCC 700394 / DSM 18823 / ISDg) TaxID=357809 RepID=A9KIW0_LACP7|nr:AraC family transcriptional regulator [Lachnoclostridium phytofermentans]ABX40959.1 transcriptional regulator, AraC family [Lachnoclostridium phytofermentans ISDg]
MSNSRYNFKIDNESEASMIHKEDSTLSYTFNPDGKQGNQVHVTLLYVAISKYGTDWKSLPHSHNFAEFFYITNGSGQFSVEKEILDVKANDLIILNPTIVHTEISNPSKPMEYIVLGIEGIKFQAEDQGYILLNSSAHKSDLHLYFNSLAHEMKSEQPYRNFVCQNLLNIIFTMILRNDAFKISIVSGPKLTRECNIAKKYIEENYQENITIETLSSLVHLNKYYFVHNFKKQFGTSPINYLIKRRIEESMHLLVSTNHSLSSISQIVGFSSPSYFSQAFKRMTNITPQEYKKMYKVPSS